VACDCASAFVIYDRHDHTFHCKNCDKVWGDRRWVKVLNTTTGETLDEFFGRTRLTQKRRDFLEQLKTNSNMIDDDENQADNNNQSHSRGNQSHNPPAVIDHDVDAAFVILQQQGRQNLLERLGVEK
jgi:hypothetical protein